MMVKEEDPSLDQDPELPPITEEQVDPGVHPDLDQLIQLTPVSDHPAYVQKLLMIKEQQTHNPDGDQENPELLHMKEIKEEEEELWTNKEGAPFQDLDQDNIIEFPLKSEDDEEKPKLSPLHQRPTEENQQDPGGGSEPDVDRTHVQNGNSTTAPTSRRPASKSKSRRSFDRCRVDMDTAGGTALSSSTRVPRSSQKINRTHHGPYVVDRRDANTHSDTTNPDPRRVGGQRKPRYCSECGKAFARRSNLKTHMRTHTGEKPFGCSVCGKRFTHKSTLAGHTRLHTGEKPFGCSECGTRFNLKSSLDIHMRVHTGEKPFICSICERSFRYYGACRMHMATHTGEKPFGCSECGTKFTRKSSLSVHMRIHTGEKPFKCSVCKKCFSRKCYVQNHMKTHMSQETLSSSVDDAP